jgi:hypothetical protein
MFLSIFWTAYIPVVTIILSVVGDWLIRSLRQLRAHAWIACSNGRRIRLAAMGQRLVENSHERSNRSNFTTAISLRSPHLQT